MAGVTVDVNKPTRKEQKGRREKIAKAVVDQKSGASQILESVITVGKKGALTHHALKIASSGWVGVRAQR